MTKEEARLSVMGAISMALKDPTLQQGFEIICKNLVELEKENAELKEDNLEWEKASDKWKSIYELTNNQLANAKELLKEFVQHYKAKTIYVKNIQNLLEQSEQFLNSEVEK